MSRPYRSKRQRPCDQCRERKLGCQTDGGPPCLRCKTADLSCTFAHPPPKRLRLSTLSRDISDPDQDRQDHHQTYPEHAHPDPELEAEAEPEHEPESYTYSLPSGPSLGHPPTQFVQSLDQLDGFSAQLFGASAESDPWLLRHCSFDDAGVKCFYKVHFRNAGGVPTAQKIPVHFMIAAHDLNDRAKEETRVAVAGTVDREELNRLVPVEYGVRLVALFVKYVFPALPIISRSQLGLNAADQLPDPTALNQTPVHLLAAIYASALPFAGNDDYLCILTTYNPPPIDRLWRIVYELVAEEIHTPHLAVLQATLLYLHRPLDDSRYATADSPFVWSRVGSIVGLACSLGLHIECRMWGIPGWEKRLRRRLWWAVYAEDKWRSLLLGKPPFLHQGEYDVSELDGGDFVYSRQGANVVETEVPFRYLVDLSRIAEDIYTSFYTLRASQYLSERFSDSNDTSRPLLEKLNAWYSSLPDSFRLPNWNKSVAGQAPYPTSIHFAYLILVVFIYRALLRPMARSSSPPLIFDVDEMPANLAPVDDYSALDFADIPEIESFPVVDLSDAHGTGETTLNAAERCASIVVSFVRRLTASDFAGFWYSWSRIGFATVSNFTMLLLVQAPNSERAVRGKHLVDSWLRVLRCQSQSFPLVKLGLTRLDAMHWAGLGQTFVLPGHVRDVVSEGSI